MYTKKDLQADLEKLGVQHTDTLLVHSSMKSIGEVENRADTVLDALSEYLSEGLLVFPTLSYRYVNGEQPVYSVRDTHACTGILPELFRKRPGVIRSLNPTHSLAALGRDAKKFTAGHELYDSPCHRTSPWGKFHDRGGKILFIGTGLCCNTYLHGVEEWVNPPIGLSEDLYPLVIFDAEGRRIERPSRHHCGGHSRWYDLMEPNFQAEDAVKYGKFGDASVHLVDAVKACRIVMEVLKKNPKFFTEEYQNSVKKPE